MEKQKRTQTHSLFDYFQDIRVIRFIAQIIFVILVVTALAIIWTNIVNTLESRGLIPSFEFLERRAGFAINQSPDWYTSTTGTYSEAFLVGVMNTLNVVGIGLVLSTVLGVLLGIFLLSNNWLIKTLSRIYVEILRNTPLLVQLIFWYFVVMLGLPEDDITIPEPGIFILWFRYIAYMFVIVGSGLYVSLADESPPKLMGGIFGGIIVAEMIFLVLGGDSWLAILLIAGLGIVAFTLGNNRRIIPSQYEGYAKGFGILAIAQLVGHLITFGLASQSILSHPQLIWTEVMPSFYIRRQGVVAPALLTNDRFMMFGAFLLGAVTFSWLVGNIVATYNKATGKRLPASIVSVIVFITMAITGWFAAGGSTPDIRFAGLPESASIGIPTFRISVFILLVYFSLVFFTLWRNYQRTIRDRDVSWLSFGIISTIFAGITIFMVRLVVPFGDEASYVTNFLWNTTISLQRETPNFPVFVAGSIIAIIAGLTTWAITRTLNNHRYDFPSVTYGVVVTITIMVMSFGYSQLPDPQVLEIEGEVVSYETALENELLPPDELIKYSPSPLAFTTPELNRFGRVQIGSQLGPSYLALLIGLVIYTSAFIGEIVRAGIQAVPYGQIEASHALGLKQSQTLQMIILPQALRVIIPPLGNQYLNLAKNSSLALAIAYADTYQVGTTVMNQSGQSITGFSLVLAVYLTMSLVISFVMNQVNSRFQLVTR